MKKMKKLLVVGFLLAICLPVIWPFLRSGYFPTHDGEWAVVRLAEMHREIKDLQFPPRWAGFLNHGFGYPLFLFSYPLPYYLGEAIHLLGPGIVNSVKLVFILSVFLSALAMFLLGRKLWGNLAGLIAAVFYLYLPFRMVDLYVRGSIGESLAFIFYPLLFWLGLNLLEKRTGPWVIFTAAALAGLILTHNVMALLFIPFWFVFMVLIPRSGSNDRSPQARSRLFYTILTTLLGFSFSAFFWLPALWEKKDILVGQVPISNIWDQFVTISQLIFPAWGYGVVGQKEALSYQIGWIHLLGFVLGLFIIRKQKVIFWFSLLSALILIFLMLPASYLFWHYLPIFSNIDFPWRLLGILGFLVCLGVGGLTTSPKGKKIALVLSLLVIFINIGYAKPSTTFDKGDEYYMSNDATTSAFDELMPVWVKQKAANRQENLVFTQDKMIPAIHLKTDKSNLLVFTLSVSPKTTLYLNKIYFPGWTVTVDGKEVPLDFNNYQGLISFNISPGRHTIQAVWQETPLRLLADYLSLISFLAALSILILTFMKTEFFRRILGKEKLLLLLIVLLGLFLRVYQIKERFIFDFDQEAAILAIKQILTKKIVFIGQEASVGQIFVGPFYYYFLTPFYLLSGFNPYSLIIPNLLTSVASISGIFIMGKNFASRNVGLIAAFLFAISSAVVRYDQTAFLANPLMLLGILFGIFLYKLLRGDRYSLLVLSLLLGLSLHLHFSVLPLFIIFFLVLLIRRKLIPFKELIPSLLIFLTTISTIILFDLRHDFMNLRGIMVLAGRSGEGGSFFPRFFWLLKVQLDNFNNLFFPPGFPYILLSAFILFLFLGNLIPKITLLWFFIPVVFFSFYKGNIPEYYFLITFPLLIFVFSYFVGSLWKRNSVFKFAAVFLLTAITVYNLTTNFMFKNPFGLKYKEAAVDYIFADSGGNPGHISLTTEKGLNFGYELLIQNKSKSAEKITGKNIYTIVAPWNMIDGPQEYYFGDIKVIKR